MERILVLFVVLVVTALVATWWRARDGRVIGTSLSATARGSRWAGIPVEAADIAAVVNPATELVLVEFTAPDCVPCARTRELLDEVAAGRDDVSVAALDVGEALDLARAHRIMRAPTTVLITAEGHLLGRVSGVPRPDQLITLLDSTRQHQTA
ncbi:hypothetical protein BH23ACT9_BH23ACT9_02060 [soil metagenome]